MKTVKTVQDKDGNVIQVPFKTPCHAAIGNALPIMYDEVLDAKIFTEMAEKDAKWELGRAQREIAKADTRLQEAYLQAWPAAKQLEAMQDKLNGETAKFIKMNADFAAIKNSG